MPRNCGISRAHKNWMHATFLQKVIICAVAGLAADKALNGGYEHRTVMQTEKK
jgi:hypothetical protein